MSNKNVYIDILSYCRRWRIRQEYYRQANEVSSLQYYSLLGHPTYVSSRVALGFAVNFKKPTSHLRDYQEERHKSYTTC